MNDEFKCYLTIVWAWCPPKNHFRTLQFTSTVTLSDLVSNTNSEWLTVYDYHYDNESTLTLLSQSDWLSESAECWLVASLASGEVQLQDKYKTSHLIYWSIIWLVSTEVI